MITAAEIIILIAGAILITVSFFVPDKSSGMLEDGDLTIDDEAIKSVVNEEVRKAKESIDEAAKLSVSEGKDKLERYMDRLTNEKMMAVNEYSDTVIEQIKKDHEEAVFLYDMIDNKHSQVKNTAAELTQLQKDVKRLSESIPEQVTIPQPAPAPAVIPETPAPVTEVIPDIPVVAEPAPAEESVSFDALTPEKIEIPEEIAEPVIQEKPAKKPKASAKKDVEPASDGPIGGEGIELMFDSDSTSMNNNDRILALHKEGKSNMAIAKELGLGVGEVKLVIDLFKS